MKAVFRICCKYDRCRYLRVLRQLVIQKLGSCIAASWEIAKKKCCSQLVILCYTQSPYFGFDARIYEVSLSIIHKLLLFCRCEAIYVCQKPKKFVGTKTPLITLVERRRIFSLKRVRLVCLLFRSKFESPGPSVCVFQIIQTFDEIRLF